MPPLILRAAPGDSYAYPQSINNAGVIARYSDNIGAIWCKNLDGAYYDCHLNPNTLLESGNDWYISNADHISNSGVISGIGYHQSNANGSAVPVFTPK